MKKKKILIIFGIIAVILVAGYAVVWLITPFPIHYAAQSPGVPLVDVKDSYASYQ